MCETRGLATGLDEKALDDRRAAMHAPLTEKRKTRFACEVVRTHDVT